MTLVFPALRGLGWSVHKKPTFSTLVASHASGREVRSALYQNPVWEFEATVDGLDSSASTYPGLGSQSLQSLMGLYLQCQGQLGTFLYLDPNDSYVAAQGFGGGDGSTTAFQLVRTLGNFVEPILAPFQPSAIQGLPSPNGLASYPAMNTYANSIGTYAGFAAFSGVTSTGSQTDPNGTSYAIKITEAATTSQHYGNAPNTPIAAGLPVTFSVYLLAGTSQYAEVACTQGGVGGYAIFDLINGVITKSASNGSPLAATVATVAPAGGGWWRCGVSTVIDASSTLTSGLISGVNSPTAPWLPSYTGSASNYFYAAFPQCEVDVALGAPGPYLPTLATPNFGRPSITVAGVYVDPSNYSIGATSGLVTFNTPPANGAALAWSGYFRFLCRFAEDSLDFENVMANLWTAQSVKFRSVRAP